MADKAFKKELSCGCIPIDMSVFRNEQLRDLIQQLQTMEVDRDIWKNEAIHLRGEIISNRRQIYELKDEIKYLNNRLFEYMKASKRWWKWF